METLAKERVSVKLRETQGLRCVSIGREIHGKEKATTSTKKKNGNKNAKHDDHSGVHIENMSYISGWIRKTRG